MITLKDLIVPEDQDSLTYGKIITGSVRAYDLKSGKFLFDTVKNKQADIKKFYDWKVIQMWPEFVYEVEELALLIVMRLSDHYKEGGLPY